MLAHQQRQQRPGRRCGDRIGDGADHGVLHRRRVAHEAHAGAHRRQQVLARQAGEAAAAVPGEQRRQHGDDRRGVERERQAGAAEQDQRAGQRRSDRTGEVEADAVQRDRLHQVLARHQLRHDRAPGRRGQRGADADREGQRQQPECGHRAGEGQYGERGGGDDRPDLRADQEHSPIDDVGQRTARQRQQEHRHDGGRLHHGDDERLRGEAGHQPAGAGVLQPGAEPRHHVGEPQGAEGRIAQRQQGGRKAHPSIIAGPARIAPPMSATTPVLFPPSQRTEMSSNSPSRMMRRPWGRDSAINGAENSGEPRRKGDAAPRLAGRHAPRSCKARLMLLRGPPRRDNQVSPPAPAVRLDGQSVRRSRHQLSPAMTAGSSGWASRFRGGGE